jgi:uncharacterized protein (TIGR02145 family)
MSKWLHKSLLPVSIIICFLSFQGCNNNPETPINGTIQGRVMNTAGDTLIGSASVSTNPPTSAVSTDAQGNYTINSVSAGQYTVGASKDGYNIGSVAVSVVAGQTTTADIYLGINGTIFSAPTITTQPQSQTVTVGQSVTFSVTATGTAPLWYQWYKDGAKISGASSSSYSIPNVQAGNAGTFTVKVSNGTLPNATSNGAVLTVNPASGTVNDIDGNVYHTVAIGTQVWTVENLKATRYKDSTAIPLVTDNAAWAALTTPGYCWNNNDPATYKNTYGALYNWHTVNTGKLAPTGWHVPTDSEWTVLITYLGGESVAGGKLKEAGTSHWLSPNTGATNETGFSALPGGCRYSAGTFNNVGSFGIWWTATAYDASYSWDRHLYYEFAYVSRIFNYADGFSVRCIKDH